MSVQWVPDHFRLRYTLSDKTLFSAELPVERARFRLRDLLLALGSLQIPPAWENRSSSRSRGFLVRSMPVAGPQAVLSRQGGYLRYVYMQYPRFYIDLHGSFEDYRKSFASKTRSTLQRKANKFDKHCGGRAVWRVYKTPEQLNEFFELARQVSQKTYQERLLDAGLPSSDHFRAEAQEQARRGEVRAYLLFDGEQPVSYLYCPAHEGVLLYSYLGYDPAYQKLSVGTVLQWHALRDIFDEGLFDYFDFTEGFSEHKRLFSNGSIGCADVLYMPRSLRNSLLIGSHYSFSNLASWVGGRLEQYGLKSRVRRVIRFGR